jgi:hypothetical protein
MWARVTACEARGWPAHFTDTTHNPPPAESVFRVGLGITATHTHTPYRGTSLIRNSNPP